MSTTKTERNKTTTTAAKLAARLNKINTHRAQRKTRRAAEQLVRDAREVELIQLVDDLASELAPLQVDSNRLYKQCEAIKDRMVDALRELARPVPLSDGRRVKLLDNFSDKNGEFRNSIYRQKMFSRFSIDIEAAPTSAALFPAE